MPHRLIFLVLLATIIQVLTPTLNFAEEQEFDEWLNNFRIEARQAGISPKTLDKALSGLQPLPQVIKLDRHQPESRKTLDQYLKILITKGRIAAGVRKYHKKHDLLKAIENKYGIPGPILMALWGIESNYGKNTGKIPVVAALATLAHDPRRSAFFRSELLAALKLVDRDIIKLKDMQGSWAGAMGPLQFLPSVMLRFKVDQNQDGSVAIWQDSPDLFATAANYLAESGWQADKPWGYEVDMSQISASEDLWKIAEYRPLDWWRKNKIKTLSRPLPAKKKDKGRLLLPEGRSGRAFLVLENFEAILTWNRSNLYALAVGLLADQITAGEKFCQFETF